jgi:two-component system, OmpR family, sensor histidine kinase KdpD
MRSPLLNRILQFVAAFAIVAGITFLYRKVLPVNATTVALTFLLAILAVSTVWGMVVSVAMSIGAMLAFNYYFLPPAGSLTVADPQNWVALIAFLLVAIISSHLSTRARQQAADASARQRDVEKLYSFSQGLLESRNVMELLNRIPAQIVDAFEVGAAALFLSDKQKVYRSGPVIPQLDTESLKAIVVREEPVIDTVNSICFLPVRMGLHPVGSLGISGTVLTRQTLED